MSVTPEERQKYQGSWRSEASTIAIEAAKKLNTVGDSKGLNRIWDLLPDNMRVPVQVALATDALDHGHSPEFAEFMLRLAYGTLERFGTDDSQALIVFANDFARALPEDARFAFRDAMTWLDRDRSQREQFTLETTRDVPVPLGREFKPAPFHEAVVLAPDLDPELAISAVSDVSDQISLYLGLTHTALTLAKRLDSAKQVNQLGR